MKNEPVLIILAGLGTVIGLGLAMTNALGWTQLTNEQLAAVVAFVVGVCTLIGAAIRGTVVSPATHDAAVAEALATPPPGTIDFSAELVHAPGHIGGGAA